MNDRVAIGIGFTTIWPIRPVGFCALKMERYFNFERINISIWFSDVAEPWNSSYKYVCKLKILVGSAFSVDFAVGIFEFKYFFFKC